MNLKELSYRLERAGFVCKCCGCKYGTIVFAGDWLNRQGICHVCDKPGRVRPVDSYDNLERGKKRVRVLAAGIFDEDGILNLLGLSPVSPKPLEEAHQLTTVSQKDGTLADC